MSITLTYFDGRGRAEVARMILHHHWTPFTDHRLQRSDWINFQASGVCEFDSLPMLEIDGLKLVESKSINRYLSQKFGYGHTSHLDEYFIESLCDLKSDITALFFPLMFSGNTQEYEREMEESMPTWLQFIEKRLVRNNNGAGWFVGVKITRADFEIFQVIHDLMLTPGNKEKFESILVKNAPKLREFIERFKNSSPTFKSYLETRKPSVF